MDKNFELKPFKSNLEKLKTGTLFRSVAKENSEPENIAVGQVSKELRFLQRQSQYATEIERVLKELRLTVALIKGCSTQTPPDGTSKQELLAYYQGNFLTLVHQMKDKITQIVHLMTEETIPEKPSIEKEISVSDLLSKKQKVLETIGIEAELKQWGQENPTSSMAVVLRKRTHHHHRVSGLRYDKDFINLNFTDIVTDPNFQGNLTDYAKQQIENMKKESTERLFSGALSKTETTLAAIEENVEKISEALVRHFKLPISSEEAKKIIDGQSEMLTSFDLVNRTSIDKVVEPHKTGLEELVANTIKKSPEKVSSIYLVGSLARGEYEEGYSDINVYLILDTKEEEAFHVLKEIDGLPPSLRVFTKSEFLSERCKKFRIIAKADGILLYGDDLVAKEKMPKAGLLLAVTLNDDVLETIDKAQKWIEANPSASQMAISFKSRKVAKRFIDFMYAVVMTNKPQFTASRKERAEKIIETYPKDKHAIETLMGVTRYGVGELLSFKNMLDGFRARAEENLKKMLEVKAHMEKKGE